MQPNNVDPREELHPLVVGKMIKIFGEEKGRSLLGRLLGQLELTEVSSTGDLMLLAGRLETLGGFEATTGAVLSAMAAMRRIQGL